MQQFEGERDFARPQAEVFAKLSDGRFLVECIPDVETLSVVEADRAEMVLRPGFSFVRGTLETSLKIVEKVEPTTIRVLLASRGIGSSSEVAATLSLAAVETGTRVSWVAEIRSLGGLLKMVPTGLIRGAAEKVINDAWERIIAKLTGS